MYASTFIPTAAWHVCARSGNAAMIDRLNRAAPDEARQMLSRCCGSTRWVDALLQERPFSSPEQLFTRAQEIWVGLTAEDWLEAFSHHPRIGDRKRAAASTWTKTEQAGADRSTVDTLAALEAGNRDYEAKFGHVFLVCATGKTGEEMLALL